MKICVFGASSDRIDPIYFEAAYQLGSLLAQNAHLLVFGGGKEGLMGACARGALDNGGNVLGIAPRFFDQPGILMKDECRFLFTESMSERKYLMEKEADAFIALPGGIGTFEEFFEVLTLKQLGRHNKPMALLNTGSYFDPLCALLRAAADNAFMSTDVLSLFHICSSPTMALEKITAPVSSLLRTPDLSLYSR